MKASAFVVLVLCVVVEFVVWRLTGAPIALVALGLCLGLTLAAAIDRIKS